MNKLKQKDYFYINDYTMAIAENLKRYSICMTLTKKRKREQI